MNDASHSNHVYRAVGTAIALSATAFFVVYAKRNFQNIPAVNWEGASSTIAVFSVTLAVLLTAVGGSIWLRLLRDNGVAVSWKRAQAIFSVAQFAKYLPGNVGQYVSRVSLAREAGIPVSVTVRIMLMESLWVVGVAAVLSLVALLLFVDTSLTGWSSTLGPPGIALLAFVTIVAPWAAIRFVNAYLPGVARRVSVEGRIPEPGLRTALLVAALFGACFLLAGLILKLQARWLFGVTDGSVVELTCIFSVAWVAGYLTPGAPGGMGVREAMMVLLLPPVVGSGVAVGLGITLRIATTLGDAVAFAIGMAMRHRLNKSGSVEDSR
ncbi:MAG: flippase-like domain-containing protein [Dehalococcoidia bacterium]|nr:flippase-like domain-containing protein [Dehalococcoidia bacterium]